MSAGGGRSLSLPLPTLARGELVFRSELCHGTGGWHRIQVARGDKAAAGTLQMQALAEWRLDGEQDKLRPLIMLPMFTATAREWGICSALDRLPTSADSSLGELVSAQNHQILWRQLAEAT
ncbi:unnamed protein product [Pleuronectes platessa]|uniref:Uncharacterized protein n=1 Tax=Pleuronectes platessa TaxID=8262 RepID=A0A9N7V0P5_PLEPL|nr:unnamed protein product [Pleuronectes platessa]